MGEGEVTLLEGVDKLRVAAQFRGTQAFRELRKRAESESETGGTTIDHDGVMVGRRRTDEMAREVVQFPLRSIEAADSAALILGRHIDTQELEFAWLDYYHEADDGILSEVRRLEYAVRDEDNNTQRGRSAGTLDSTELTSGMPAGDSDISEQFIDVDDGLARGVTDRNGRDQAGGEFTTQGVTDVCDWCNFAVGSVCTTMCGAAGGFACGLFGITVPIAGVSCLTFVTVVCEVADRYSGCGAAVADEVCDDRFNVC